MTRRSIIEYAEELKKRYFRSSKEGKGKMLDEFTQVKGLHRKAGYQVIEPARPARSGQTPRSAS